MTAVAMRILIDAARILPPSIPPSVRRRYQAWARAMAEVLTTEPNTTPSTPNGLYSAADTATFTARFPTARLVLSHGFWRLKKVREKSRLAPFAGRESAHTHIASDTRFVASPPNAPRW